MTESKFHKMHGLGNDFVIIDGRNADIEITHSKAAAIANRRTGIGCDQLILLQTSKIADVKMRIFNNDGSEVEACGNASRCVVKLIGNQTSIETAGGVIEGQIEDGSNQASRVTVDMGAPRFEWDEIPLAYAMDSANMPLAWDELENPIAVNVGNPHAVFIVPDSSAVELERLGPRIENDSVFPDRINVNVANVKDAEIYLRVWERGVGETQACGTGACATAVSMIRAKKVSSPVKVHLAGGTLLIDWQVGQNIQMTGDATHVFTGYADWDAF